VVFLSRNLEGRGRQAVCIMTKMHYSTLTRLVVIDDSQSQLRAGLVKSDLIGHNLSYVVH